MKTWLYGGACALAVATGARADDAPANATVSTVTVTAPSSIADLRDIPTDSQTGKRTLAVVLGDHRTRELYVACIVIPFCVAAAIAAADPLALIVLAAAPFALAPLRLVRRGASGPGLITALGQTGRLQLAFGALLTVGLAIRI